MGAPTEWAMFYEIFKFPLAVLSFGFFALLWWLASRLSKRYNRAAEEEEDTATNPPGKRCYSQAPRTPNCMHC